MSALRVDVDASYTVQNNPGAQSSTMSFGSFIQPGRTFAQVARAAQAQPMRQASVADLGLTTDEEAASDLLSPAHENRDSGGDLVISDEARDSESDDEAALLADRPLDPGDSMYRGRAPAQSRIQIDQQVRDLSPIRTRRRAKEAKRPGVGSNAEGQGGVLVPLGGGTPVSDTNGLPPKARTGNRKRRSSAVILSEEEDRIGEEEDASPEQGQGSSSQRGPHLEEQPPFRSSPPFQSHDRRVASRFFGKLNVTSGPNSVRDNSGLTHVATAKTPLLHVSPVPMFLDLEAQESGDESAPSERGLPEEDDYDYADSFIDDSQQPDPWSDGEEHRRERRSSIASSEVTEFDDTMLGYDEPDPVAMALNEREAKRLAQDEEMDAVRLAATRHKRFLIDALERLNANESSRENDLMDEDRLIALATRDSLYESVAGTSAKRPRHFHDGVNEGKGTVHKGKGRAQSPPNFIEAEELDSDGSLSEDERDRKRLRQAIDESRGVHHASLRGPGESSNASSSSLPTDSLPPHSATAVQTPHTPTRRRPKITMTDMMAVVDADQEVPADPASCGVGVPTNVVIESMLLPPPPRNEVPIDKSDPIIRRTDKAGIYRLAVALAVKSWCPDALGPGHIRFCGWVIQCPDMDAPLALSFIVFENSGVFGNLARMDLSKVFCLRVGPSAVRRHAVTSDGRPFIFLTTGFLQTSRLISPSDNRARQRYLEVIPHEGEHQRMSSAACTVFGLTSMKGQYAKNALQFSTRAEFSANPTAQPSVAHPASFPTNLFVASPALSSTREVLDSFSLPRNADVPVYNATEVDDFVVNTDLPYLESKLPRWRGEIPYGSFVVVGYTMTAFLSGRREWTLGLNIQWAIIVGVPEKELQT